MRLVGLAARSLHEAISQTSPVAEVLICNHVDSEGSGMGSE